MDHLEEIFLNFFDIIYVLGVIWIKDGTTKFNDRYHINLEHANIRNCGLLDLSDHRSA
jgi:hypothetical protein